jgi:hypothetical protein
MIFNQYLSAWRHVRKITNLQHKYRVLENPPTTFHDMNYHSRFQMPMPFRSPALVNSQSAFVNQLPCCMPLLPSLPAFPANHGSASLLQSQRTQNLNFKAQAQLQAQQIDSAIKLLKMQYDAIMSSVEKSASSSEVAATQSPSSTAPEMVDQASFAVDFELPRVDSACAQLGQKRKQHADDSCDLPQINEGSEPSKKRKSADRL